MPLLLLLFIGVPLVELYILIQVGSAIGALTTVVLCVLTALAGAALIRMQGLQTMMRARQNMALGMAPAMEMLEGIGLAVAGALLLTPGFATDLIGFALLIPPLRGVMIHAALARARVHYGPAGHPGRTPGDSPDDSTGDTVGRHRRRRIIEGEYRREE